MNQERKTEEIALRRMNPASSVMILLTLVRKLVRRKLLHDALPEIEPEETDHG